LKGLDAELNEAKNLRLDGEGISQSDNKEKSIEGEIDDKSIQSDTEEDIIRRVIEENEKLMLNPPTV
jgi:hypothetical protein